MKPLGVTQATLRPSPRRGMFAALMMLSCVAWVLGARAATMTASLDRSTIGTGESATLSLTFEGGKPRRVPVFQVPEGLAMQYIGEASRFVMGPDGRTSSSLSHNYQITASRAGTFVIPAIRAEVNGETLTTRPIGLRVIKSTTPASLAFLRLIPSKETVFVGEMSAVEVQLYLGVGHDSLQMPQLEGDGFIFGRMGEPAQSEVQAGNQRYTVGTFRASAVAVKAGKLALGPAKCSLVLHIPIGNRRRGFFDDFFGGGTQRKPATLSSETQSITVLPLPKENQPSGFNGAVGSFTMTVNAAPTNLAAGDPITLRLQVAGQGNLESLPFPSGTDWPEFKLYPPTSKIESSDPLGITGVKTFERVVIPQKPGVGQLPSIELAFFDPVQKSYRTVKSAPIPLSVTPSSGQPPQPTVLANASETAETEPPRQDIVHIKPHLGVLDAVEAPLVTRPWFLALQAVPLLAFLSAQFWRKRKEKLENNPRLRRRLLVNGAVRKGLRELYRLVEAHDSDAFFVAVFRLLQEQLGERLDLPASAITEAVVDERLRDYAPEELVTELRDLFQVCNQARYAPQRSPQELMDLVPRVEAALKHLASLPDLPLAA